MTTIHCPKCKEAWEPNSFLTNQELRFDGYQPYPNDPKQGLFLFTHIKDNCFSTLAITVEDISQILSLPSKHYPFVPGSSPDCKGFCSDPKSFEVCTNTSCSGEGVRKLIHIIRGIKASLT